MCGCYAYSVNLFFGSCMSKGIAMNERTQLLETIANLIADYREGQLAAPSPQHVERWVNQFVCIRRAVTYPERNESCPYENVYYS